jgi:hypothetical protein
VSSRFTGERAGQQPNACADGRAFAGKTMVAIAPGNAANEATQERTVQRVGAEELRLGRQYRRAHKAGQINRLHHQRSFDDRVRSLFAQANYHRSTGA